MSIEGQGHFFTKNFPGFVCFVLYLAKISGEHLQDHWSSGLDRVLKFSLHDEENQMFYQKQNQGAEIYFCLLFLFSFFLYLTPM